MTRWLLALAMYGVVVTAEAADPLPRVVVKNSWGDTYTLTGAPVAGGWRVRATVRRDTPWFQTTGTYTGWAWPAGAWILVTLSNGEVLLLSPNGQGDVILPFAGLPATH